MVSDNILRITTIGIALFTFVAPVAVGSRIHSQKAHVRFLATGTIIRGNFGTNQDTYLAELTDGDNLLIRLVDEYPNEYAPLSAEVLTLVSGTSMRVIRDTKCDRPYEQMLLRAAPGDPLAILLARLVYQPKLEVIPAPESTLPCYRVIR